LVTPANAAPNSRAPDRLGDGEPARRKGEPGFRVDQQRAGLLRDDHGTGGAVGAPVLEMLRVLQHANDAVRGQAARVRADQRARRGGGHFIVGACTRERARGKRFQRFRREFRHPLSLQARVAQRGDEITLTAATAAGRDRRCRRSG
jgi:hypothetical protein